MKNGWKSKVFLVLRLVLGAVLLVLAIRQMDWTQVLAALANVRPGWLLAALVMILVGLGLRIWRWQLLLENYQVRVGIWTVAAAYLIGQAANTLMPVRSGEIFRFGWLRARYHQGSVPMVVSIAIEKYLDLFMLLLFFLGVMPYLPVDVVQANLGKVAAGSAILTVLLVIGAITGPRIGRWLGPVVLQRFPRTRSVLMPVVRWLEDSAWLQSPRRFLPALALSLVAWPVMALTNQCVLLAVGLPWDLRASVLVLVLVYVGMVPAVMPGNIGPFHFFAMLALSLVGINDGRSAIFALFLHLLVTLPPILFSAAAFLAVGRRKALSKVDRHG